MTNPVARGSLARAFKGSTDAERLQAVLRQQAIERERKEELKQDEAELMDFAMAMASIGEIDAFRIEIDAYDAAAVKALYENERNLALVQERLDGIFAKAHVLPDGRRVFKTNDGERVFDEYGRQLEFDLIDPHAIADERPRWETVKPELDEQAALMEQRGEIIDYQDRLDDARERLDAGDIARDEFDEIRKDLTETMPDAVRKHAPGLQTKQEVAADRPQAAPTVDLNITADMMPSVSHRRPSASS